MELYLHRFLLFICLYCYLTLKDYYISLNYSYSLKLENFDFTSLFILQVFIYGENEHKGKEDSGAPQEMPNIMSEMIVLH